MLDYLAPINRKMKLCEWFAAAFIVTAVGLFCALILANLYLQAKRPTYSRALSVNHSEEGQQ